MFEEIERWWKYGDVAKKIKCDIVTIIQLYCWIAIIKEPNEIILFLKQEIMGKTWN